MKMPCRVDRGRLWRKMGRRRKGKMAQNLLYLFLGCFFS